MPAEKGESWTRIRFLLTIVFAVPRNNALLKVDPGSAAGQEHWSSYQRVWGRWNGARTLAGILSFMLIAWGVVGG